VAAQAAYRGYWKALLVWGVIASVLGWIALYNGVSSAANDLSNYGDSSSNGDGGLVVLGGLLLGVGGLLFLPGVIGWGIHASGLTRSSVQRPQ
jgi:hypothetical protein